MVSSNLYWPNLNPAKAFVVSALIEIPVTLFCYPLWNVKIKEQIQTKSGFSFNFFKEELKHQYRTGGIRFIYRSCWASCALFSFPVYSSIISYEFTKFYVHENMSPILAPSLASITADLCYLILGTPLEKLQTKIFAQEVPELGFQDFAKIVHKKEGLKGLYTGFSAAGFCYLPAGMIWWSIYENLKTKVQRHIPRYEIPGCLAGSIVASITASTALTPFDLVKTRMMNGSGTYGKSNLFKILYHICKNEGVSCIFRGMAPRLILAAFEGVSISGGYEFTVRWACD